MIIKDYAVVGSGVGGSCIAALLNSKGYSVALFEKEPYLGGCSSTFTHKGYMYNTGATTLAGYEDGYPVKEILDEIGVKPKLIETDPSIVVIQNNKVTPRYKEFDAFFKELNKNYPHAKNYQFWKSIYDINRDFYKFKNYYYSNKNIFKKLFSLFSFLPLLIKFHRYFRADAYEFTKSILNEIDDEYLTFLESQVYIVAQAPMREISFFTAALSLAYTFNSNHYVIGGFSRLFDEITKDIDSLYKRCEIVNIIKYSDYFELHTGKEVFKARKLILNSTVYDSSKLFKQKSIKDYYKKYESLNNYQSSFMFYMTIKSDKQFHHHYQLIQNEILENSISKAIFVSFSDVNDDEISKDGHYSVTASIHTDSRFWEDRNTYMDKKRELQRTIKDIILKTLDIDLEDVVESFGATSKTFEHYIKRSQLGGNAMSIRNMLPNLPGNDTSIKNLYNVGDSVYAAQGWPGVMLGVKNLKRLLSV